MQKCPKIYQNLGNFFYYFGKEYSHACDYDMYGKTIMPAISHSWLSIESLTMFIKSALLQLNNINSISKPRLANLMSRIMEDPEK